MSSKNIALIDSTIEKVRQHEGAKEYTDDQLAKASAMLLAEVISVVYSPQFELASTMGPQLALYVGVNMFAQSFLGQLLDSGALNPLPLVEMFDKVEAGVSTGKDDEAVASDLWGK